MDYDHHNLDYNDHRDHDDSEDDKEQAHANVTTYLRAIGITIMIMTLLMVKVMLNSDYDDRESIEIMGDYCSNIIY